MLVRRDQREHLSQPNQRFDDRRIDQRFLGYQNGEQRSRNGSEKATALVSWLRSSLDAGVLWFSVNFSGALSASRGSDTHMMRVWPQPTRCHDGGWHGVLACVELQLGVASWSHVIALPPRTSRGLCRFLWSK
jgi:hypothetical protein